LNAGTAIFFKELDIQVFPLVASTYEWIDRFKIFAMVAINSTMTNKKYPKMTHKI